MEQNPLEQQNKKIEEYRMNFRKELGETFDRHDSGEILGKIDSFKKQLYLYEENGLQVDKEKFIEELDHGLQIKDREAFIAHYMRLADSVIVFQATNPKIFEKIQREATMNNALEQGRIRLSDVLNCWVDNKNGVVHIHIASARDYMNKDRINDFKNDLDIGFKKLAEVVRENKNIKKIIATSWVVAASAERFKKMGFTVEGEISKEFKEKHFQSETRPVYSAFISREDFLARYGDKEN